MVILNHFFRNRTLLPNGSKVIILLLLSTFTLSAEIIPFFNPLNTVANRAVKFEVQGFIANDPVSLKDFFHGWNGDYSPRNGNNAAMEMARVDIGTEIFDDCYMGYFYQRDMLIKSNRGFVDGFYAVKNKIHFNSDKMYDLELDVEGVERHGIVLAKSYSLYDTTEHHIQIGTALSLSYDTDTQSGKLNGKGVLHTDDSYSASAYADYHFMNNLLYDGWDVDETYGIGYGFDLALLYENSIYDFKVQLIINDLFARTHWKNLPHSLVNVQTENQIIGDDGYAEYNPTISGWETYKDFIQKISTKYHIDASKQLDNGYEVELGFESVDFVHMPYLYASKMFNDKKVGLLYEHRFHSIGIDYTDRNFHLSISSNGFSDVSAIGFSANYQYRF